MNAETVLQEGLRLYGGVAVLDSEAFDYVADREFIIFRQEDSEAVTEESLRVRWPVLPVLCVESTPAAAQSSILTYLTHRLKRSLVRDVRLADVTAELGRLVAGGILYYQPDLGLVQEAFFPVFLPPSPDSVPEVLDLILGWCRDPSFEFGDSGE